ncbi:MAG: LLM class flavin-dependent oxidoreductase [Proteobacteria bacterium]|nr:LLM class flavin-dependent oxidoreductase [Pseudomonadota bacterium]MBI3499790.1 LLM class flavin-dependent oxidoreductase [Pseudomonadota bacterium]
MLTLSVLDQSPIRAGGTPAKAIAETLELAALADRLGYRRYWVAEHHSSAGLAGTAPEILITRIAALTRHLRVGSGGVMLSHYSALKVAETFRVLEALYPGRIDLGIGRAPGSDQRTAMALQHGPGALSIEHFPQQIADLQAFLRDEVAADHPFHGVHAMPAGPSAPELWLLGSSDQSAAYAAHFGAAFSFAHFITEHGGIQVMQAYRKFFRPSPWLRQPTGSIGVFVLVAESDAAAERLATSRDLWRLRLDRGILGPIPSVEEAEAYPYAEEDRRRIAHHRRRQIVGSPERVKQGLEALASDYGVEEVVVVSICFDHQARLRSYELLAEAFQLERGADST